MPKNRGRAPRRDRQRTPIGYELKEHFSFDGTGQTAADLLRQSMEHIVKSITTELERQIETGDLRPFRAVAGGPLKSGHEISIVVEGTLPVDPKVPRNFG